MLIIVAIAVLAFVAVMILLAVAAVSEYGQWQRIRFDASAQPFMLSLNEAFDPDHALLWSTQIPALRVIHQAGGRGVKYAELLRAYHQAMRTFPELYEGSSFAQWLLFLHRSELIVLTTYRVKLTAFGRDLLEYCPVEASMQASA